MNGNHMRSLGISSCAFLVALLMLGCQAPQGAPVVRTTEGAAQTPLVQETLKVGISMRVTGQTARGGIISERLFRMSMDDVNARGGIRVAGKSYRYEAVTADDKFTSEGGREAANLLVFAEKVKLIFGPGGLQATAGAQPVTEDAKVLMVPTGAAAANLGPKFPLTISIGPPHGIQRYAALFDWLVKEKPQQKRIAFVGGDDVAGRTDVLIIREAAAARGLGIVVEEFFPVETKDYNPVIARVLRQSPDVIMIDGSRGATQSFFLLIAKAISEQGFKGLFAGGYGTSTNTQAGTAAEGFVFPVLQDRNFAGLSAMYKDVASRYIQKYGESEFEAPQISDIYNSPYVLAQAMEKAGTVSDTEKIANVLRDGEWETVTGKARFGGTKTFGARSLLEVPVFMSKIEGGKVVTFNMLPATLP